MATIVGTAGNDTLPREGEDNSGDDTIFGLGGADVIVGGAGKDTLDGGGGADTFRISTASHVVAGERYIGGDGIDTIAVINSADLRSAIIGADVERLTAFDVDLSTAQFGRFQDVFATYVDLYGGGTVNMTGKRVSAGVITLIDPTSINITGSGANYIFGSTGNDVIVGGDGDSSEIDGGNGDDRITGGAGEDILFGGVGRDTINGGAGDDALIIRDQADVVARESYAGGTGLDTIFIQSGASSFDLSGVTISSDVEAVEATVGTVLRLTASQVGNFQSITAKGVVVHNAGTIDLTNATLALGAEGLRLSTGGNALNLTGVSTGQQVTATGGTNTVLGSDADDFLGGANGSDTLRGGAGDDVLIGGRGKDTLDGGAGDDSFSVGTQADIVAGETYVGGSGFDSLSVGLASPINLSAASIAADVEQLTGYSLVASLTSAQLDNFKSISAAFSPALTLTNAGSASLAGVTIDPFAFFNLSAAGNTLTLTGSRSFDTSQSLHFTVNGGAAADTITGGDGIGEFATGSGLADDTLNGGGGNDTINGGAGNDFIYGGAGKDTINGGNNDDTLIVKSQAEIVAGEVYGGGNGIDTLDLQTAASLNLSSATISLVERLQSLGKVSLSATQLGAFSYLDTGDVTLTGAGIADLTNATVSTYRFNLSSAGNTLKLNGVDTQGYDIRGGAGRDNITGGDNGDYIAGGGNNDILAGGAGADIFAFLTTASAGVDQILDFSGAGAFDGTRGEGDLIDLPDPVGFFDYIQGAAFSGAGNSEARFAGNGTIQVDMNGNGVSDLSFLLKGMTAANQLSASDFLDYMP